MRKVIITILFGLFIAMNSFAFETQKAVENSACATSIMQETGATVEELTVWVAKEYLILIAKNAKKPLDVFNWSDEQADEVTDVVNRFYYIALVGRDYEKYTFGDAMLYEAFTGLVNSTATLVETLGFDEDKAFDVAVKTIKDLNEKYGE